MRNMNSFRDIVNVPFEKLALNGYLIDRRLSKKPMSNAMPRCTSRYLCEFHELDMHERTVFAARYMCFMARKLLPLDTDSSIEKTYNLLVGILIVKLDGRISIADAIDYITEADDYMDDLDYIREQSKQLIRHFQMSGKQK